MIEISITLGIAYFNQGFVNIRVAHQHFFGVHGTFLNVYLGNWQNQPILATINRTANRNGTPRIMIGVLYVEWVQANHHIGENLIVTINNPQYPNSILIQ
jgi:hypothetical protein